MNGPLQGIQVLDVSRILSGPFCTMLLADLGAEVVKVEHPGDGDPARHLGPTVGDDSAYFISVNRGKKSITLDLATEEGQGIFRKMVPQFDVLVENFVPGTMARFGIDYESLKPINPRLVYASISGFGQDGPDAQRPALDVIVQAMGGIMSVTGEPGGRPMRPGASLGDSTAGTFAALAIVSALFRRETSGRGEYIDLSMLDCQITVMENAFSRYFATGQAPGPIGSRHPAAAPFQAFRASDGDLVVALLTDDLEKWHRFCEAVERPDLADNPRYTDNAGRMRNVDALAKTLDQVFSARPLDYWLQRLSKAGVPCGPVNDVKKVAENPQIKHRGMLATIPHSSEGAWRVANTPFKFAGGKTGPAGPSPKLGENTRDVLAERLGLSERELDLLRARGVV